MDTTQAGGSSPSGGTTSSVVQGGGSSSATAAVMKKTTTISTIAVQSGRTRLVIAILHCGDWIQLKILDVVPELTSLGNTLAEALELQKAHDEVLRQLQNKQSPVEELLRQADTLISTQRPRAEVYAAMAESLGRAWNDVNLHLARRQQTLAGNVTYHQCAEEFHARHEALEAACRDSVVPVEIAAVKEFLTGVHELRRAVLEALMGALQAGNGLIADVKELGVAAEELDSRPERIRSAVNRAVSQVQGWMDELHMKRQVLEATFIRRKSQLEQCLALAILASDLRELEDALQNRRELLQSTDQLGDSASSAELLLLEHHRLLPDAKQLQERAIKITKATEQLVASGCFAGEEATRQAYTILSAASDYLTALQQRGSLIERVIAFFKSAEKAFNLLNDIENQLKSSKLPSTSSQLAALHLQCSQLLEEITQSPLAEGHAILALVYGNDGIRRTVEELENRKISLGSLCTAHKEETQRIHKALNAFLEKQQELELWLISVGEAFLQRHRDMGRDLQSSKEFLRLHNELLNDLQTKGNEINALLITLPPILEHLEDQQRSEVDRRVESLHERWINLKNLLEQRLDLSALYVKFHGDADLVNREMDQLEQSLREASGSSGEAADMNYKSLEEKWEGLVPLYQSAKNTGITFVNETNKIADSVGQSLDTESANHCVQNVLEALSKRQLTVTQQWETYSTDVIESREVQRQLQSSIMESTQIINIAAKADVNIYPIITTNTIDSTAVSHNINQRQATCRIELLKTSRSVAERIRLTSELIARSVHVEEASLNVKNKLLELELNLQKMHEDYVSLTDEMQRYVTNVTELKKSIGELSVRIDEIGLPREVNRVECLIGEHEQSRETVLQLFRTRENDAEQLIARINETEPYGAAQEDIAKLQQILVTTKTEWEKTWREKRDALESHRRLCQFDSDLQDINHTIDELGRKVEGIRGKYGESLSEARSTSNAFGQFERTIDVLEGRINQFVQTGEELINANHLQSPHIQKQISNLLEKWNNFKKQVQDTRRLIDLSLQYFELINKAEEWFREGNQLLSSIARETAFVKRPEEAQRLLDKIEVFLKPEESKQTNRIEDISRIALELFGDTNAQSISRVLIENREIIGSFTALSNDLNELARKLKFAEEQQELQRLEAQRQLELERVRAANAAAKLLEESAKLQQLQQVQEIKTVTKTVEIVQATSPEMKAPVFVTPLENRTIEEGQSFTFMCHVTGEPLPVVTWHKDGISIQNNPDYQTTFDRGHCTLTIEETFGEDTAEYTCRAISAAGSAQTTAVLTVRDVEEVVVQQEVVVKVQSVDEVEVLLPPVFSVKLVPGNATEGGKFEFKCRVEGNPLPTVQWFKNSYCIDNSPEYIMSYNNGEAILHFERIYLEDKASYSCKATNVVGMAESSASLNITPLAPSESPAFIIPLSNVMARAGQKIKLECEFSGLPPPQIQWSHNGKNISESREFHLQTDSRKATLIVNEAFPKDAGSYSITASNLAGSTTSSCTVSVKGRLPTETSDSEQASDMEPVKPSIQTSLKDTSINEGNRVRLDCVIVGQPEPEVIWYHNDCPVKESPDFQLLFHGDRCSLIIKEALPEDSGKYRVVALNSAGEASSQCNLTVAIVEKHTSATDESYDIPGVAPKFTKLLSDILVAESEQVILEASVTGDPVPEVRWFLNNVPISPTEHTLITHDDQGNLKLEIKAVLPEDRGVYTVKASNPCGDAKCFAQLIVKSIKQPAEAVKVHEEQKSAPVFKETFQDQQVFENNSTKFECKVTGKPTPKVRWLFNEQAVSGKNFLVSTSGDRQILTIPDVAQENAGTVTCIAENDAGKATCSARLIVQSVTDLTMPQLERTITDVTLVEPQPLEGWNKEVKHYSESKFSVKREVHVESTKSSSSKTMSSVTGEEPVVEEHSVVSTAESSFKQVNDSEPVIQESKKTQEYHKFGKDPAIVQGETVSTASLNLGQAQILPSPERAVVIKPAIKMRPPKFMTPVIGKIIDQGADVILEGILDGQPSPQISWTKNGLDFTAADNVTITYDHNCAKIVIKNASTADAGRYTCTAINDAGKAVSTSDLVVRKTVFPPVFGRRLQAQVIKKSDRVNMEVEVTGTPDPTVTWFKDGRPIHDALKDGFRIKTQGNCHTMVLEKADSCHTGKYMVRAVNAGGEAQSIADIAVFEPTPDTMVEVVKTVVFEDVQKHETLAPSSIQSSSSITTRTSPILLPSLPPGFEATQLPQSVTTEISQHTEQIIKQESKTFTLEHTAPEFDLRPMRLLPAEIIDPNLQPEVEQPPETVEEGIETASITKQSSLDFFVKKMKQVDEPVKVKETPKVCPIKQELYTKFEETAIPEAVYEKQDLYSKLEEIKQIEVLPPYEPIATPISTYKPFQQTEDYSYQTQKVHIEEEFNLAPEPPAEICFAPQETEVYQQQSETREKIARFEPSLQIASSQTSSYEQTKSVVPPEVKFPVLAQDSYMQKSYEAKTEYQQPIVQIPQPKIERPRAEGIIMEKTWAHKHSESSVQKSWPPAQTEEVVPTWSAQSTLEKRWTPQPVETPIQPVVESSKTAESSYKSFSDTTEKKWSPVVKPTFVEPPQPKTTLYKSETVQESVQKTPVTCVKSSESSYVKTSSSSFQGQSDVQDVPLLVPHYVARVSHSSNIHEQQVQQEQSYMSSQSEFKTSTIQKQEQYVTKPYEPVKFTPPQIKQAPQVKPAPQVVKPIPQIIRPAPQVIRPVPPPKPVPSFIETIRPVSVQDITDEVYLEPGPPPEIGYAEAPRTRKQSYVETIEQDLERNLEKAPTRVLAGAVRTMPPPPLPPKKEQPRAPPVPTKTTTTTSEKIYKEHTFERFPVLEPFPFTPEPEQPRHVRLAPPPTPSKFVKGKFTDSDYESDFESARISSKWRTYASDNEESGFRHVNAPKFIASGRSRSIDREAMPPSAFERPAEPQGITRPFIDFTQAKALRTESETTAKKTVKHFTKTTHHEIKKPAPLPAIKPGSPPEFVQQQQQPDLKSKPQSPKSKHRSVTDGYQADTDEPFTLRQEKKFSKMEEQKQVFQQQEQTQSSYSSVSSVQKVPVKPHPVKFVQHKKHVTTSSSSVASATKELVSTPIISVSASEKIPTQPPESYYTPEPQRPKKPRVPPPPSPSKFTPAEFHESEYESDYGHVQPVWTPQPEQSPIATFKPVRPVLTTPAVAKPQSQPQIINLPSVTQVPQRPKFQPIEKPVKSVNLETIIKPVAFKQQSVKNQKSVYSELQPGSPPELAFAPATQYYRSTTSAPYHNAVQTETSNAVHFNESTASSHRTVSMQQTTKVIKFGAQETQDRSRTTQRVISQAPARQIEEHRPRRSSAPPTKPTKFIPGEFRESDYESEVESTRIRSRWTPGPSDSEEPHYKKVDPPSSSAALRSLSLPSRQERVISPLEFDQQHQYSSRSLQSKSAESRQQSWESHIKPGSPPEFIVAPAAPPKKITKQTATKIASKHMDSMSSTFRSKAQQFASDIMEDVNKKTGGVRQQHEELVRKKVEKDESDAQVYREETRAAQYGTKHVDPDTGLIYFKYDFGYEFGIVLPGEGKSASGEIPRPPNTVIQPPARQQSIEMPVYHETKKTKSSSSQSQSHLNKTSSGKNVKWEPTSESEMSEYESETLRRSGGVRGGPTRWEAPSSCSPVSISPSLPSVSPAFNSGQVTNISNDSQNNVTSQPHSSQRVPSFITPLRDIAVVCGQPARFECIVQSEPPPTVLWSKNGRILENSNDYQIFFKNGVCRLTISKTYPEDAGTYTCTATNQVGTSGSTANLQVPGERRSSYIK